MNYSILGLLLVLGVNKYVLGEFTAADCRTLGFIKPDLMCSTCKQMDDFGLSELKDHCFECCQKDDDVQTVTKKYPKAVLEVCTCKFGVYPQIQAFIKSDRPAKFPNLQIKYLRGIDPIVKMMDSKGNVKEVLSISKWNTDTVEEFFMTHLEEGDDRSYLKTNEI